jgi:predicted nuclease of predicted toxin-antitoxin system
LGFEAKAVQDLGLQDETNRQIFLARKGGSAVVMTKDSGFIRLLPVVNDTVNL